MERIETELEQFCHIKGESKDDANRGPEARNSAWYNRPSANLRPTLARLAHVRGAALLAASRPRAALNLMSKELRSERVKAAFAVGRTIQDEHLSNQQIPAAHWMQKNNYFWWEQFSRMNPVQETNLSRELESSKARVYRFSVVIEKDKDGYFAFSPKLRGNW